MTAPIVLKTAVAVGAVGEVATLAVAQTTGIDKTVIVGAALTFGGLLVTAIAGIISQRTAARDAMKAEAERFAREEVRESREAAQAEKIEELHREALSRAEAPPDVGPEAAPPAVPQPPPVKP